MRPYFEEAGITIYHGDCREILPHVEADVLVTDPPYGIVSGVVADRPTKAQRGRGMQTEAWDRAIVAEVPTIVARFSEAFVWGGNYYALPPTRGWLCWIKPDAPPSMGSLELCWTTRDAPAKHIACSLRSMVPERVDHLTQKPLAVMSWTLGFASNGVVVDPFMGSGTTLRACKDLGRRAIGIELDERHCETAARRLAQQTLF